MLTLLASGAPSWTAADSRIARLAVPPAAVSRTFSPHLQLASTPPGSSSLTSQSSGDDVDILVTGVNSRCISASIVVDAAPSQVWSILTGVRGFQTQPCLSRASGGDVPLFSTVHGGDTAASSLLADYDNLATHVPNLVASSLRPHPTGGIRLFQEGAQNIVGFDFRASLTMDMCELVEEGATRPTVITFDLVDSAMFASFDGEWRVQPYSRIRSSSDPTKYDYKSKLSYRVNITPKGLVPVPALEWRIKEDVPVNLQAVKAAAEKRAA